MRQALPSRIRPLDDASVMVGRARTAAFMEVYHVAAGNPYKLEIALIDSLQPGDIPVFACFNPARVAPWGELLSTAASARKAAGALMDGCVRDIKAIREDGFSGVPRRHRPARQPGPRQGDGDRRADRVRRRRGWDRRPDLRRCGRGGGDPAPGGGEVLRLAFEKISGEKNTLRDLQRGDTLGSVFERYGIL